MSHYVCLLIHIAESRLMIFGMTPENLPVSYPLPGCIRRFSLLQFILHYTLFKEYQKYCPTKNIKITWCLNNNLCITYNSLYPQSFFFFLNKNCSMTIYFYIILNERSEILEE